LDLYREHITREGADKLLDWLTRKSDFFTAPASSRFHLPIEGGLVQHACNVAVLMFARWGETESAESLAICGLLHDLCKANTYKVSTRNVKNDQTGVWEKHPYYQVDELFPYGHGEKSVFLADQFIRLLPDEAMAIRWHMGGFDDAVRGGSYAIGNAFGKYPLAVKLHLCDIEAAYLIEGRKPD